jgi:hypothetical protein
MSIEKLLVADFGPNKANATGSSGVGYVLLDVTGSMFSPRTTSDVYQTVPGIYAVKASLPSGFLGQVVWDTGNAFSKKYYVAEPVDSPDNLQVINDLTTVISSSSTLIKGGETLIEDMITAISGNLVQFNSGVLAGLSNIDMQSDVLQDLVTQLSASAVHMENAVMTVQEDIIFLRGITAGRWHIIDNQMIFYGEDNVTEIARYNLLDDNGQPSMEAVFDRVRVI